MARGSARLTSHIPRFIYFYATVSSVLCGEYGIPIEIKVWDAGRTPLAHMVDITNGFGLKVLAEHNFLNDNNIAFSPYGLMGILVALYEGVDGESSYQIQRGMQLPWNRNVMRIGFRDIHRTLKTYFVPEEGFLAGLALNNENVTFNESYKKILRFYGFDLENDKIPALIPESNGTINISTSTEQSAQTTTTEAASTTIITTERATTPTTMVATETVTTPTTMVTTERVTTPTTMVTTETVTTPTTMFTTETVTTPTTMVTTETGTAPMTMVTTEPTSTTATKEESTVNADAETIGDIDPRGPTATSMSSPAASNSESSSVLITAGTTSQSTVVQTNVEISSIMTSFKTTILMTTITPSTSGEIATTATTFETTTETARVATTPTTITTEELTNNENLSTREITSMTASDPTTPDVVDSSSITTMQVTNQEERSTSTEMITETSEASSTSTSTTNGDQTVSTTASTLETLERRKRSLLDYGIFTKSPKIDDYLIYRSFDIPVETANTEINTNKMFLVNGLRNVQVSYMHYDTVLEHAYLPHLEASALRLPLDSDRYYLLVVLPSRGGDVELGRLLARMARESDLSDVYAALRPRRVRAIVPSFTVKGHVTLTTDLQKLGIRDVFEPRQHDFTPMTRQPGVYVRSIEQAVSVAIRKYQPDDHKKNRYVTNRNRVFFSATYPFLYFVMDSNIHVALMAGKMVDPLNTRIL